MSARAPAPRVEFESLGFPLNNFPADIFRDVFAFLEAHEVCLMWFTGNSSLQRLMVSAIERFNFLLRDLMRGRQVAWPHLIGHLSRLKEIIIDTDIQSLALPTLYQGLNPFPPNLRALSISCTNMGDFWRPLQKESSFGYTVIDFRSVFPLLEYLKLEPKNPSSFLVPNVFLLLPASLTSLDQSTYCLPTEMIALTPELTSLKTVHTICHFDMISPHLTTLHLSALVDLEILKIVSSMDSLTDLNISMRGHIYTAWNAWPNLPRDLLHLYFRGLPPPSAQYISNLPQNLKSLQYFASSSFESENLMGKLPQSLTLLELAPDIKMAHNNPEYRVMFLENLPRALEHFKPFSYPGVYSGFDSLPRTLRTTGNLRLQPSTPTDFQNLPRSLEDLSILKSAQLTQEILGFLPTALHRIDCNLKLITSISPIRLMHKLSYLGILDVEVAECLVPFPQEMMYQPIMGSPKPLPIPQNSKEAPPPPVHPKSKKSASPSFAPECHVSFDNCFSPSLKHLVLRPRFRRKYVLDFGGDDGYQARKLEQLEIIGFTVTSTLHLAQFEWTRRCFFENLRELIVHPSTISRSCFRSLKASTPSLELLQVNHVPFSLSDDDLGGLPRTLKSLRVLGPDTHITLDGLFDLPRNLTYIAIPSCPQALLTFDEPTVNEAALRLPPKLGGITFGLHASPENLPWRSVIAKMIETRQKYVPSQKAARTQI